MDLYATLVNAGSGHWSKTQARGVKSYSSLQKYSYPFSLSALWVGIVLRASVGFYQAQIWRVIVKILAITYEMSSRVCGEKDPMMMIVTSLTFAKLLVMDLNYRCAFQVVASSGAGPISMLASSSDLCCVDPQQWAHRS